MRGWEKVMFAYLKGTLEYKNHEMAIVDVGGVGYRLTIPFSTYQLLPELGTVVKLNTYMAVREDNVSLFGFYSAEELRIFELLIGVSGIGPKLAVGVLSDITPAEFSLAVITDDVNRLTKISGIGKKMAQRMIIELKDKMKQEDVDDDSVAVASVHASKGDVEEAATALQVLGYSNKEALQMAGSVYQEGMSVEEIIKLALKSK